MSFIEITPRYNTDLGRNGNVACSAPLAAQIEAAARSFVRRLTAEDFTTVTLIAQPYWVRQGPALRWWGEKQLVTVTAAGRLHLFSSQIRDYGLSPKGELFVGRDYPEIDGTVFLCLYPLMQCSLDAAVLRGEVLSHLTA